jgi:hypothetical protein
MHVSLEGMKVDAPLDNPRGSIGRAENFSIALQHTQSHIRMPPAEISSRIQEISP